MIKKNSIKATILSVILVVFMALSLSSCYFEFSIQDFLPDDTDDGYGNNGNQSGNSGSTSPDNNPNFYPNSGSESLENVSAQNRTLLSTVSIIADFGSIPTAGSGVIYSIDKEKGDAYIVTNYHVIYYGGMADAINLYLYGMENKQYAIPAQFVGGSIINDIAVLKVTGSEVLKNSYAIAATFTSSENVRVFDKVIVVGNAEGYGMSATTGIISVESEPLEIEGADDSIITLRVMRVDGAINLGNSGGGLYDENGNIIGIVCAKRTGSDVDDMGYAIPADLAKNLIDNIIDNCNGSSSTQVKRPVIGITVVASTQGIVVNPETGEISQKHVTAISSISDTCVVKDRIALGDIINSITINGEKIAIERYYQVPDTMLSARVGDEVVINITRGSTTFDVSLTVTESMISLIR